MKKSLIALAVAGVVAAPAAFAATSNVDVYGKIRIAMSSVDGDWGLSDQASRIGFKGSEDLGGGLKAIWQIESGFTAAGDQLGAWTDSGPLGQDKAGVLASRNTFVGLAGGFGTFLMGRHDTPYKLAGSADLFADTMGDAQGSGGIIGGGRFDLRADSAIAYITPDYSGFHAAVAIVSDYALTTDVVDAWSLALVYANGPLKVTAGFEDHQDTADESAWKLNGSYTIGDLTLGATYESQEVFGTDYDNYLVSAAYGMGPITLALQYGDTETLGYKQITAGAIYGLSKRTNVAVAYSNIDPDGGSSIDVFTVQMNHDF
ncbi:MAG: porin [Thiobacillus sp.]|nr:porin [Thiobacillus sp.]